MKNETEKQVGNWVPVKMIAVPAVLGLLLLVGGFFHWIWWLISIPFWLIAGYFTLSYRLFSPAGADIQNRIHALLVSHIRWDGRGKALDIGCGNGPLTIRLAQAFPAAHVTGMDYWGNNWDYSLSVCEENARRCGVADRVAFQQGSAASLPFADGEFDLVVSNLVFHEVPEIQNKRDLVREALRVLKPGGFFVLQDLFLLKAYYGDPNDMAAELRLHGYTDVEFIRTCDEKFIPRLLKLPFMVGTIALLKGRKGVRQ